MKPGQVSPELQVPAHIPRPPYVTKDKVPGWDETLMIHSTEELPKMRAACKLAAQVLQGAGELVKPGVTTDEIDKLVHQMTIDAGAYPSPLRYGTFPKSVCTSVNDVLCHGIPDSRPLEEGDIVNIDVTVYLNGYHGDNSSMFACGAVDDKSLRLMAATKQCLEAGIAVCGPGVPFKEIGAACEKSAKQNKMTNVADFCGHGVGTVFHAAPMVQHCRNGERSKMEVGQTFTIEPILCTGKSKFKTWSDKWTAVTLDGCRSAQYEHTILITPNGYEVLTVL